VKVRAKVRVRDRVSDRVRLRLRVRIRIRIRVRVGVWIRNPPCLQGLNGATDRRHRDPCFFGKKCLCLEGKDISRFQDFKISRLGGRCSSLCLKGETISAIGVSNLPEISI